MEVGGGANTDCRGCADRLDIKRAEKQVAALTRDLSPPAAVIGFMINLESERSSVQVHV